LAQAVSFCAEDIGDDMAMIATLIFAVLACGKATPLPDAVSEEFKQWAKVYEKEYESEDEGLRRFGVFAANREFVNGHNIQAAAGVHTFTTKLNAFADMTVEEYRETMLGLRPVAREDPTVASFPGVSLKDAPATWDWRQKGVVAKVKDQASCGSCWAFSAVAAMEGAFNLKSNGSVPAACSKYTCGPNKTPCCSFSEQELVDCVNNGKDNCKVGGEMHDGVMEIVKQMKGVFDTESEYPYTSGGGTSTGQCNAKTGGVPTGISGYTQVTRGDEKALMMAAWKQPILAIGIDASQQSFQFYSEGVYVEPNCKNKVAELDHGVAIVGYGVYTGPSPAPGPPGPPQPGPADCVDNNDAKSCTAETGCHWCQDVQFCMSFPCDQVPTVVAPANATGTPYWIVKNSWNAGWGMDGYILMAKDKDNQCGVSSDAIFVNIGSQDVASSILVV